MRITISGTHFTGKSTLAADLCESLPAYEHVDEPYFLLEEEGYEFPDIPGLDDCELQLRRSLREFDMERDNVIFDRSPLDFLGYIYVSSDFEGFDTARWLRPIQNALNSVDVIFFLPVETRDRIVLPSGEDNGFRLAVDAKLQEIILDNSLDLDFRAIEIVGSRTDRVAAASAHIK